MIDEKLTMFLQKQIDENKVNFINLLPVVLYDDNEGSTSNITLSDDVANYSYIEIFYNTTGYENSTKISSKKASLISHITNTNVNQTYISFKNITLNGTSLIVDSYQEWNNNWGTTSVSVENNNTLKITKVLGYK